MHRKTSFSRRPHLVIIRAGDSSLHPQWLSTVETQQRTWDILVSYFGEEPNAFCSEEEVRIDEKGPKWPAIYHLVTREWNIVSRYKYIWFPDDDLACTGDVVNRFFDLVETYSLALSQPSLSLDSFVNHPITAHNPGYLVRYTNFVEIMAPCFDITALAKCADTFETAISAWGLDHLWSHMLDADIQQYRVGIVDGAQVRHTRPRGGPSYSLLRHYGFTAEEEMRQLLKRHEISRRLLTSVGAYTVDGRLLSGNAFMEESYQWNVPPW